MDKRGQAHTLVLIILLLIIFYIVLLPPAERRELLEDTDEESSTTTRVSKKGNVSTLLEEFPGTLVFQEENKRTIDIPNINLIASTQSKVLTRFSPLSIRNGVFDKRDKSLKFTINELKNTDNIFLSFVARRFKGDLIVKLNGEVIYLYEIATSNIEPIELDKNLIKDSNVLEFSVGDVGWRFWRTNEYNLEDVKIIGDVTDLSRQKSQNSFVITNAEIQNIERMQLRFVPFCNELEDIGNLEVQINNRNIYSSMPVCGSPTVVDINRDNLNSGSNIVIFRSEKGSYSIEQIKFNLELKETRSVVYFFELNQSDFINVTNNRKDIILAMRFVDDEERKIADVSVNGHRFRLDQTRPVFTRNINGFVEQGNNFIEITPKVNLNIVELNVSIKKV